MRITGRFCGCVLLTAVVFAALASEAAAQIRISSFGELCRIGKSSSYPLNGRYELTCDIDASDSRHMSSGFGFDPIGSGNSMGGIDKKFSGSFDGKGHTISGLYINRPKEEDVGLFGYIFEAKITGVRVIADTVAGRVNVGALVGRSVSVSVITRCYSEGVVIGVKENAGGLAGFNNGGVISLCYSTASVNGNGYLGGLVGYNTGKITHSYAAGLTGGGGYLGGLVGYNNNSSIYYSYSTSTVKGGSYAGGLIGYSNSGSGSSAEIKDCYSIGAVSGTANIGGLIGYRSGGIVTNCFWDIERSGQSASSGGTGKTGAEMKTRAAFKEWDFDSVWHVGSDGYPSLRGMAREQR